MFPIWGLTPAENDTPTMPPPGSVSLEINEDYEPCFFSATWTIRARVNGVVLDQSETISQSRITSDVKLWARSFIYKWQRKLRELGVDVEKEYESWGGLAKDL